MQRSNAPQTLEERLSTPIEQEYDVIVAGGGASGLIAAIAAARSGARTLLVEHAGCLGGTGTYGMVAQWLGFYNGETRVVGGLALELTALVEKLGGSDGFNRYVLAEASSRPIPLINFPFNPEIVKIACDRLAASAGVDVRLHSRVCAPMLQNGRVCGVVVEDIAGRRAFRSTVVIDATGDAVVASAAGVKCAGEEEESRHHRQPCTLMFRLSNVDVARFRALPREEKRALALAGVASGRIFWESLSFCSTPGATDAICLMGRLSGIDALNAVDLSRAEIEGRSQADSIVGFLRERVPGFERANLANIAARVGVRETRRIHGRYTLCEDDIVNGKRFSDSIALGAGPMDLHDPASAGISLWMPEQPFEIPLSCLLPEATPGLIVTGRAISATRSANGGSRHMATAMALGHASGVLAAMATSLESDPAAVDAKLIQTELRNQGALISLSDV